MLTRIRLENFKVWSDLDLELVIFHHLLNVAEPEILAVEGEYVFHNLHF